MVSYLRFGSAVFPPSVRHGSRSDDPTDSEFEWTSHTQNRNVTHLALVGSRGIPARYGGFETVAGQLATLLSRRGYLVSVSCERTGDTGDSTRVDKGVNLVFSPLRPPKPYWLRKFYEILSDAYFTLSLSRTADVICLLGYSAGLLMFTTRFFGRKTAIVVNIDGAEWKRDKFSKLEKGAVKVSLWCAMRFAHVIIVDSRRMRFYVPATFRDKVLYAANGVHNPPPVDWDDDRLSHYTLRGGESLRIPRKGFWLVVARLEPENNIDLIINGFARSSSSKPLIVVGDFTSSKYERKVKTVLKQADKRIVFTGAIYDLTTLNMLRQNAFGYIHGHSVGGTNPSLLEAMVMGNLIVAHGNEFNREVCADSALYFMTENQLSATVNEADQQPEVFADLPRKAKERALSEYSWHKAAREYESVFQAALKKTKSVLQ